MIRPSNRYKNSDKINYENWSANLLSIANTQPESAISIGQLNWQGKNEIRYLSNINGFNTKVKRKASNEKIVSLRIYTESFVKHQNMQLILLVLVNTMMC